MIKNEIAIVGGEGFVGSRLNHRLAKKNLVYNNYDIDLSNKTKNCFYLDVEDLNSLNKLSNSNIIINLAAVHRDDVKPISRYDDVNVTGAKNICHVARKFNITKIIFTSSVAIYGFAPPNSDENSEPNYFNDYGRTKYLAEQVYKKWQSEDPTNRSLVIIRPTVIFGEGNRGNVFNLLKQIASRKFAMFGNGKNKKSMAYVENVAAFIEYSLKFNSGLHIYNYIDKPDLSMNQLTIIARKTLFNKENIGLRLPKFLGVMIGYIADVVSQVIAKNLPISSIQGIYLNCLLQQKVHNSF